MFCLCKIVKRELVLTTIKVFGQQPAIKQSKICIFYNYIIFVGSCENTVTSVITLVTSVTTFVIYVAHW